MVAAEAMLILAGTLEGADGRRYRDAAAGLLHTLTSRHLVGGTACSTSTTAPPGMLLDGCYDMAAGTAVAHELIWGDYFLLAALLRLRPAR
jgi:unsaturated chondroitin disaccharide hydrolase